MPAVGKLDAGRLACGRLLVAVGIGDRCAVRRL